MGDCVDNTEPKFGRGELIQNYRGQVGTVVKVHPPETLKDEMYSWGYTVRVDEKLQVWLESLDELKLYEK